MTCKDAELISLEHLPHEEPSVINLNNEPVSIFSLNGQEGIAGRSNDLTTAPPARAKNRPRVSSTIQGTCIFIMLTMIAMMIGILIVCFKSPKPPGKMCKFILKSEANFLISGDSHPNSIAAGDFNNDGLPDLVVPNSGTNNIGVFLRYNNGTFSDQITYSTGLNSVPYAVTIADFNNDKRLDIAVANFGSHTIGLFLGTNNGTFKSQITFSTGAARPTWVVAGDFNNDTHLDVAVVNYGTNDVGVLLGDGNGNLGNPSTFSTGFDSVPYSLAVADFNNDGHLDMAVANYGTDNVGVLLGHGDGKFTNQIIYTTGANSHPYSIAVDDLNNDTHIDIVVACSDTDNIAVFWGFGNGTFSIPSKYSTGNNSSPISVVIADFDNDNALDIAVANYGTFSVGIFFGYGNGVFSDQSAFYTSDGASPYSIATSDFNNDTRMDIAVINYDYNYIDIILTYRNYSFSSQSTYRTTGRNSYPQSITIADFNNDNRLDIVVANYYDDNIGVFFNEGANTFTNQITYSTGSNTRPYSVVHGDFNNDSQLDIVVANNYDNSISIFLGNGKGTFSNQRTYSTGSNSQPNFVAAGDFNNDFRLDIVVINHGSNNVGVFLGNGNGTFLTQKTFSTGNNSSLYALAIGYFNDDNRLDIAVVNYLGSNVGVFLGYGNGTFSSEQTYSTGTLSGPFSIALGDLNGDSLVDIAVANYDSNDIGILFGDGNGTFILQDRYSTGIDSGPYSAVIADFNNDSRLDIVVVNSGTNNIGVFLGYVDGQFSAQTTYSTGSGTQPIFVAVADLNTDGWLDIATVNGGTSTIGVLNGYGNGSFSYQNNYSTRDISYPVSVAVADFDNDRLLDVAVANYDGNNLDIFYGSSRNEFSWRQISYATDEGSEPYSVATGDFNNDGQLDMVAVNYGTNNICVFLGYGNGSFLSPTTYSTDSDSLPYDVVVGDFNNDSRLDVAVANYGMDNIGVFLGYGNGTFAKQNTFSTGSGSWPKSVVVGDFNSDSRLDIGVVNYQSDNFGLFLGYGDGTFSNQTSYFLIIGSGPNSATVGDLDNDGHLDVVITVYYRRTITILFGFGNGTFASPVIYSTGSGSRPKSTAIADLNNDNWLDIIASNCVTNNVVVFFGDGDGTFSDGKYFSTGANSCPTSVAVGDFNKDSLLDIIVANSGTNTMGILLGLTYIKGIREATHSTGSSPQPRAITLGDFNNDTQLDLTIVNYDLGNVGILLGQTNGTFSGQMTLSMGALSFPTSLAVGDLNNDSQIDLAVANSAAANIGILFGYGNGSFTSPDIYSTGFGSTPQSVVINYFNNDSKLDVAVANSATNNILVFLSYDAGTFRNQTPYLIGANSNPKYVTTADLNNDGRLDFVTANSGDGTLSVFLGLGDGNFSSQMKYSTGVGSYPRSIAIADVNNDTYLDFVISLFWGNCIGVLLGFGDGTFPNQMNYTTEYVSGPREVAVADFNNDNRLDIAIVLQSAATLGIFFGYGNGTFSNVVRYSTGAGSSTTAIAVADLNNDNRLDLIVANFDNKNIGIFFGYGNGTFSNMISYSTGTMSTPQSIVVGDFNNDTELDFAVANGGADNIGVFFGYGNGTFSNQMILSTGNGSSPAAVGTGDFNKDGLLDIAVINIGKNELGIFLGYINGTFFNQLTYSTGDNALSYHLSVGDFNGDNRSDIVVVNAGTNTVNRFFGYAANSFLKLPAYSTGSSSRPTFIAVGDIDNDTKSDVVVANNGTNNIMILFGSGYGTFTNQMTFSTGNGSQPCSVAVGDLNNDQWLDIVVANSGTNSIGVFLNTGSGTFFSQMTYFTGLRSKPYSVAVLDFDNDTRMDIAVANFGSNNVGVFLGYGNGSFANQLIFNSGFRSHPYGLAVGDVNKDSLMDIVVTNNGYGNIDILTKTC